MCVSARRSVVWGAYRVRAWAHAEESRLLRQRCGRVRPALHTCARLFDLEPPEPRQAPLNLQLFLSALIMLRSEDRFRSTFSVALTLARDAISCFTTSVWPLWAAA